MADKPSPIDVQKVLGGMDYPASKKDIVSKAEGSGAGGSVLEALNNLPERQYDAPTDISKEIFG
ncbi:MULTISPECIES: DUF2795 domain-containing protein [unclassified Arthrobacter]|uniref:DUF2795 domain-containing protein n=1 Tax=unclassified Arthrobacter TaxID=235627 RepID=UPI001D1327BD|nr:MULTISPECIES: DUF2795 domain-containing protein [unclassified Arthrobacter]MCC3275557.1 DUF2795 domain-containing protein [Arthrobacter sp. zg-Y20]MCC3278631.1 DUF2795 domain-containing protein [Arthrobacter sp. zg-Y40]MCC9176998.1 DUF2795 domain-containing protein [Arthrobacter sp. zg-Y750]MDK1315714.1 DUF2795 domain-containing protein [Arthrobacter sp. zg.Y20]MDK1326291.1 DUF2795 domain-containing protein [Arthrobacter sp. zg-Y1143]